MFLRLSNLHFKKDLEQSRVMKHRLGLSNNQEDLLNFQKNQKRNQKKLKVKYQKQLVQQNPLLNNLMRTVPNCLLSLKKKESWNGKIMMNTSKKSLSLIKIGLQRWIFKWSI